MDKQINQPLVSVVLPVYNGEEFLAESIQSVINQTYKNWELIIVDDCSTDNSNKIAQEFAQNDERIRVIRNEKNLKLPASLNAGFECANGKYFSWTSDDNEYYPEAFSKMVDFLENNSYYGMVYAICELLNCPKGEIPFWGEIAPTPENLLDLNVCGACFLYRADAAKDIGNYDTENFLVEDYDYILRIRLKYNIANIPEVLYKYRLHPNSLTSNYKNKARLKGIKLAVKYFESYSEKFPYIKNKLGNVYKVKKVLINKNQAEYNNIKKENNKKYLYSELKQFYKLSKDKFYLKSISELGIKYIFKAFGITELK